MKWIYIRDIDTWIRSDGRSCVKGIENDMNDPEIAEMYPERADGDYPETEKVIGSAKHPDELREMLDEISDGIYSKNREEYMERKREEKEKAEKAKEEKEKEEKEKARTRKEFWKEVEEIRRTGHRKIRKRKKKNKRSTPEDIRQAVLKRDNYTCQKCGSTNDLHVHHIKYRSEGGSNDISNLITLCEECHYEIHKDEPVGKIMKKHMAMRK